MPLARRRRPDDPTEFAGRVVVVTGAGSGIGRATALAFGRLGATVHVADLNEAAAEVVAAEVEQAGGPARAHRVDVADARAVDDLAERVYADGGAVDVLHNNAGIGHGGLVEDTPLEDWRRVVEVNLMGVVHGVHAFVPRLLAQGRPAHIVNTASMAGLLPAPQLVPYSTTKAGVVGLSEALDAEMRLRGVRVTALCPGIIHTAIVGTATMRGRSADRQAGVADFYRRRGASPDVVARAVVDAVRRPRVIVPTPRWHVVPLWLGKRLSPRMHGSLSARVAKLAQDRGL